MTFVRHCNFLTGIILLSLYAAICSVSHFYVLSDSNNLFAWLPFGLILALLISLQAEHRIALAILAALIHSCAAFFFGRPLFEAMIFSGLEVGISLFLVGSYFGRLEGCFNFDSTADLTKFALAIGFGASVLAGIAYLTDLNFGMSLLSGVSPLQWGLSLMIGGFIVSPLVLSFSCAHNESPSWVRVWEANLYAIVLIATCFGLVLLPRYNLSSYYTLFAPFPLLVWSVARFGMVGVSTTLLTFVLTLNGLIISHTSLVHTSPWIPTLWLQTYSVALILFSLPMTTLVAELRRISLLFDLEFRVSKLISEGTSLNAVLDALVRGIEEIVPHMLGSILLYDEREGKLHQGAAPSLPISYNQKVNGVKVGPCSGSCGTAVFRGEKVIVEDIFASPLWQDFKGEALAANLRACWSQPIRSSKGLTLGTFAMYYREPRRPSTSDVKLIDQIAALAGVAIDRDRVERRLVEREQSFSALLSNVSGVTYRICTKSSNCFELISGGCVDLFGCEAARLEGPDGAVFFQQMVNPEDRTLLGSRNPNQIQIRRKWDTEYRITTVQGVEKWIWDRCQGVFDSSGNIVAMDGLLIDVTDRHRLDEQKSNLEQQLRQSQKMEAMGTLAGGIAHDFNNMLGAMIGFSELARKKSGDSTTSEYIGHVLKACHRAKDLVRQILTFSRKSDDSRRLIDMRAVIDDVLVLLRGSVSSSIEVRKRIGLGLPKIFADETQIHQVVLNLANNASHAMKDSGGILEIILEQKEVDLRQASRLAGLEEGDYLVLSVCDSGVGMNQQVLERAFDPFFTTKAVGEGTGLGLSMVHGIVKSHQGAIDVVSKEGVGTKIKIYFPIGQSKDVGKSYENAHLPLGHGERIMLVDDEESLVHFGREALVQLGYEVKGFTDSKAALECFLANPNDFDLLLTDETMPGVSGKDLAEKIRMVRANLPVVASSGFIMRAERKEIERSWRLDKPYTIDALAQTIHQALIDSERLH